MENCTYIINSDGVHRVQMKFKSFWVEIGDGDGDCSYDYTQVYEDEVESPKLCGKKDIDLLTFNWKNGNKTFVGSKQVRIYFYSDGSASESGWQAVFRLGE